VPITRILLVEDNEMNRDMLSRRLTKRGYDVTVAVDGEQGIDLARTTSPELVLMDMSLPGIDGWEATRLLKSEDATRHIPIIAITAHAMAGDRERALEIGCDDYDTKPIDLPSLLDGDTLRGKLGRRRPRHHGEVSVSRRRAAQDSSKKSATGAKTRSCAPVHRKRSACAMGMSSSPTRRSSLCSDPITS
jgi:CheY-like chemotaxis protein